MLIDSQAALDRGVAELCARHPRFAELVAAGAVPHLRKGAAGFAGLAAIVMGQQISTASAAAIRGRLDAAFPDLSADTVASTSDEALREIGLSRAKIATLRAMATAVGAGTLALGDLAGMEAERARDILVAVPGIGPWTAQVYLLFCLGHPDVFPAGDLALQEAARLAFGLPSRPTARDLAMSAEDWRPWRGVAAYVLWAHYRVAKSRDGAPVGTQILAAAPSIAAAPARRKAMSLPTAMKS